MEGIRLEVISKFESGFYYYKAGVWK